MLKVLQKSSIRTKMIIALTLLMFVIGLFISWYFPYRLSQQELKTIKEKAKCIAQMTAFSVAPALFFQDKEGINTSLQIAQQNKDLVYIIVYSHSNQVVSQYPTSIPDSTDVYQITIPIQLNNQLIGGLRLGISKVELKKGCARMRATCALVSFLIFAFGNLLVVGLSTLITKPLRQIVKTAKRICQGDLTNRASIPNSDEIGLVAKAFNEMLDSLESTYRELKDVNQHLEARVRERTKALEEKILELNRTTERLRESEAKYRIIFENSHVAIYITTYDGQFVNFNDAFLALFGYSKEEMANLNAIQLYSDPQDRARFQQLIEKTGYVKDFELKLKKKDGTGIDCLLTAQVQYGQDGRVVSYHGMIYDITEMRRIQRELKELNEKLEQKVMERTQQLKQTYEQLRKAQEQAYQAQKMESIGILAGGIAHDFNNLLATIIGNISLAKMMISPGDKIFPILTRAENTCLRAKDLTQALLTFSRGGEPIKKIVSINKIIKESANIGLKGSKVSCEFDLLANIWPIEADEAQLMQVFNNLIINACQAMPEGGIIKIRTENLKLAADNELQLPEGTYVKITIQDQGIGIAEENLAKIFDPFYTTKPTGSGLGLTIAYSIIKRHKGIIKVQSKLGVGTTCQVYLPASHKEILVYRTKTELPASFDWRRRWAQGTRILVMDDEEDVQATIKAILTHLGFEVSGAKNGEEAIRLYKQAKETGVGFSAVIMDLTVKGGMGGKETIVELLKIDPQIKAIVSSGYADDPILTNYEKYGFCASVTKPFRVEEIAKVLNSVLQDSGVWESEPTKRI